MDYDYSIDHKKRLKDIQGKMEEEKIDVYLGSRLRTLSYVGDVFCPWRSFIVIPQNGEPSIFTFVIDAERVRDDSWLDDVRGFGPLGGGHQIDVITDEILEYLPQNGNGRIGVELGMSNYLPEGNLTTEEFKSIKSKLPNIELVNAIYLIDELSMYKTTGEINRFRKASDIVDIGHKAVLDQLEVGQTETEIAGVAEHAMRKVGSEWACSFTGGNEIATGYRTAYAMGACTPATRKKTETGELASGEESLYQGEVGLEVKSSGDFGQVARFLGCLRAVPDIELKSLGTFVQGKSTAVVLDITEPLRLLEILMEIPAVKEVSGNGNNIKLVLK